MKFPKIEVDYTDVKNGEQIKKFKRDFADMKEKMRGALCPNFHNVETNSLILKPTFSGEFVVLTQSICCKEYFNALKSHSHGRLQGEYPEQKS